MPRRRPDLPDLSQPVLQPGDRVAASYEIVRFIHSGGMGQIFEALNVWTQRPVALKVLPPGLLADAAAGRRFMREAQLSARLTHPNIVRILDMGLDADGFLFMVHELVHGESLEARIRRGGKIPVGAALKIMLPILDALAVAHDQGIVHRDVKPGNILLAEKAPDYIVPQLTDFGLAKPMEPGDDLKITEAGRCIGTPRYMSPEQLRAERDVDGRTDVWSVGVTLYEALTGRVPFEAQTIPELVLGILRAAIPPPSSIAKRVPPELDALILKALARKREGRHQTMREMYAALRDIAALMQSASAVSSVPPARAMRDEAAQAALEPAPSEGSGDTTRILRAFSLARPLRAGIVATSRAVASLDFAEAFTKALGLRCDVLRYFNYAELVGAVGEREVELAWLAPVAYLRALHAGVVKVLLGVERAGRHEFSSALLGRSGVADSWEALAGRRAVWVDPWSAAGYLVPRWMMRARGHRPDEEFASQGFLGSHEAVLDALRAGTADVGATFCATDDQGNVVEGPWTAADQLTPIAVSSPIPGDTICAAHDLSDELTKVVVESLSKQTAREALLQLLGASRLAAVDHSRYEAFEVALRAEANETRRVVRE